MKALVIVNSLYIGIVSEIMSSKEVILGENLAEMQENASISSKGESYDDILYGSDVQPPDLAKGYVMVHENCCRARYRPSRAGKNAPYYICLNRSECRSLAGGQHPVLRGCQRAEPGVYEGASQTRADQL